jgi:hypothetical protein
MSLIQIKSAVRRLSLDRLKKLDEWLHELIRRAEESESVRRLASQKQTVVGQTPGDKTYRQESIRCGKENCKCAHGKLHGPYWYSYTRVKGKVTSQYVGKSLPRNIQKKLRGRGRK